MIGDPMQQMQLSSVQLERPLFQRVRISKRLVKTSNFRDSNYSGFLLGGFQGDGNFVRIGKSSNYPSSN